MKIFALIFLTFISNAEEKRPQVDLTKHQLCPNGSEPLGILLHFNTTIFYCSESFSFQGSTYPIKSRTEFYIPKTNGQATRIDVDEKYQQGKPYLNFTDSLMAIPEFYIVEFSERFLGDPIAFPEFYRKVECSKSCVIMGGGTYIENGKEVSVVKSVPCRNGETACKMSEKKCALTNKISVKGWTGLTSVGCGAGPTVTLKPEGVSVTGVEGTTAKKIPVIGVSRVENKVEPIFAFQGVDWTIKSNPSELKGPSPTRGRVHWPVSLPFTIESDLIPASEEQTPRWSFVYDGKSLGTFSVGDAKEYSFPILSMNPLNSNRLKQVRDRQGGIVLAANRAEVNDPENWHRAKPDPSIVARVKKEYLNDFPKVMKCQVKEEWEKDIQSGFDGKVWDLEPSQAPLKASEIEVVERAFLSKKGHWLLGVRNKSVRDSNCLREYYVNGFLKNEREYYQTVWFALIGEKTVHLMRGVHDALIPLEAADFDGNGKSEWIFDLGGGYILYWEDFSKSLRIGLDWG